MKILYCNVSMVGRSGTEVVTLETVEQLLQAGHQVAMFVTELGRSAESARSRGLTIINSLNHLDWTPDVIHSNHVFESLTAASRFPHVPQVFICHDSQTWHSGPPLISAVRRGLAVDQVCQLRIESEAARFSPTVELLPNAVDMIRFKKRDAIPERPRKALILSKHAIHRQIINEACAARKIEVEFIGPGLAGCEVDDLPSHLAKYDLVFATGRMALESAVCGCGVIVVDGRGMAGRLTSDNLIAWRKHNFGRALLTISVNLESLLNAIDSYNREDALNIANTLRGIADLDSYVSQLEAHYRQAIAIAQNDPISAAEVLADLPFAFLSVFNATVGLPSSATSFAIAEHSNQHREIAQAFPKLQEQYCEVLTQREQTADALSRLQIQQQSPSYLIHRLASRLIYERPMGNAK